MNLSSFCNIASVQTESISCGGVAMRILICKCPSAQGHDENTTTDFTARCDKVTAMVLDVSAVTKPQPDGANSTWNPSQVPIYCLVSARYVAFYKYHSQKE